MKPNSMVAISNDPNSDKKRAVRWNRFIIDKDSKQFLLVTFCHFFETDLNEIDQYGKQLKVVYERTLVGSNQRIVNPNNGKVVTQDPDTLEWKDKDGNITEAQMGQYDFYTLISENMPIIVDQFLTQTILDEDSDFKTYDQFDIYA